MIEKDLNSIRRKGILLEEIRDYLDFEDPEKDDYEIVWFGVYGCGIPTLKIKCKDLDQWKRIRARLRDKNLVRRV